MRSLEGEILVYDKMSAVNEHRMIYLLGCGKCGKLRRLFLPQRFFYSSHFTVGRYLLLEGGWE